MLQLIAGRRVTSPVEVDEVVWSWILEGVTEFGWDVWRAGGTVDLAAYVTEEEFWSETDLTTLESWSSGGESSFSRSDYDAEHPEEFSASWEESVTTIEETVTTEEFGSEMSEMSEEMTSEETTEEPVEDGSAAMDDDAGDISADDAGSDEGGDEGGGDGGGE